MKRILMVLNGAFPVDDRVEKEAVSLINEGYEVHLLCLNFTNQKDEETYKDIIIHRKSINKLLWNKLFGLYLLLPVYRILAKKHIQRIIKKYNIYYLHIHDLPLSDIGYKMKRKYGIKLICDQHEYYSNWIVNTATYNNGLGRIVKFLTNWTKYEKKNLKTADLVITVEEPLRQLYINEVGIKAENIIIVPNTPAKELFNLNNNIDIDLKLENKFVLLYIGGIDTLRGIDLILEAVKKLESKIPNLLFLIAGKVQKGYYLEQQIKHFQVEEKVRFDGWVDISLMPSYIKKSDICLFTPPPLWKEINNTIATKIYQYLSMGKPVIVSDAKLMKNFIEDNKVGFAIGNSTDLADKIMRLHNDKVLYESYSKNAIELMTNYYWEKTIKNLLSRYENL